MKWACFFILLTVEWGTAAGLAAQDSAPYLVSAKIQLSVESWADIWLNGIRIVNHLPYTDASKGCKTVEALPHSLCYFRRENVLALQVTASRTDREGVGIAYTLFLKFSNGDKRVFTSDEADQHKAYYLPDRMENAPAGWVQPDFDDTLWGGARIAGFLPYAAAVTDPLTGRQVPFLSSYSTSFKVLHPGERHFYRRKFFLDIAPNPICGSPVERPAPRVDAPVPEIRRSFQPRASAPAPAFTPTFTSVTEPPVFATPTPLPTLALPALSAPPDLLQRRKAVRPTATPDFSFVPRATAEPCTRTVFPTAAPPPTAVPTPGFTPQPLLDQAQTLVFGPDAANIYVTFADGPGRYRVAAMDDRGNRLKFLLDKWEIQGDAWVGWDGRDEQGRDLPAGQYRIVFSKDGKILNKIIVVKVANP